MKKILLIGASGQIGWELRSTLVSAGQVIACTRQQLDLSNPQEISEQIRHYAPEIIVNAAAYTAVDKAESEPELAFAINGKAPGIIAEEAKRLNALLVHYSTDYVFDGTSKAPYTEEDMPNPINIYGKSKLEGENNIKAVAGNYLILRTSWVYGTHGHNFLLTMLKLAKSKKELKVVADQFGAPTWSRRLADSTAQLLAICNTKNEFISQSGIYHMSAGGYTNWCDFARAIFKNQHLNIILTPISSHEYDTAAKRPTYSVLSNLKLVNSFGISLPSWERELNLCLKSLYT